MDEFLKILDGVGSVSKFFTDILDACNSVLTKLPAVVSVFKQIGEFFATVPEKIGVSTTFIKDLLAKFVK